MVRAIFAVVLVASLVGGSGARLGADPGERMSSLAGQGRVNVTIYNSDLALVHDRRSVKLLRGENRIAWRDVSANLDGTSSMIQSLTSPGAVSLLEQNFNFDLLRPSALLEKAVGQTVIVVHNHPPGRTGGARARQAPEHERRYHPAVRGPDRNLAR